MLDTSITDAIVTAWNTGQSHPNRERVQRELPPAAIIRRFLDEAFLATLSDEEGQPIRFSIAIMLEKDVESLTVSSMQLPPLRFETAIQFSAATLAKVASAFDPALTTILVRWEGDDDAGALFMWGIWTHASSKNQFTRVPIRISGTSNSPPDYFTLISKGRAKLAITRGNGLIGTFQAGYFSQAAPTPFTTGSLGQYVLAAVQNDPIYASVGMHYWNYVREAMEMILSEASLRGHGGTIVFLPPDVNPAESSYASKYKLSGSFDLQSTLHRCIETEQSNRKHSMAYREVANEILQRISQLAAIDGALILSFSFHVLAFGATLTATRSFAQPVIGPNGFGQGDGRPFDINRYGTRHRSAMDFAAAIPESIVFVISQDGPIRAFRRKDENTVEVWPDCTASMFV